MRDGRRKRLGLQEGGGADASQSDFLDRILSDTDVAGEPNILSLEPDANVRTTDQRYLSDAYNYFLGGGADTAQIPEAVDTLVDVGSSDGGQATSGVNATTGTNTSEQQRLINEGIGVQLEPGAPISAPGEGMPPTQKEIDAFNQIPVNQNYDLLDSTYNTEIEDEIYEGPTSTYDAGKEDEIYKETPTVFDGTATLEDAGAGEGGMQLAEVGLGNEADFTPSSTKTVEAPYGINPNTGEPYQTPRTIADQNAILGQTFAAEDVDSEGNLLESGINKMKSIFPDFDPLMAIGKIAFNNYIGAPITLAVDVLKAVLPEQDPRQTALDEFYTTGEGAQYLDPSSENYIPGMENYNIVSGSDTLNKLTGGKLIDETTYGLQEAYQDRIDTINESLNKFDKYNPNHPDYDPAKTKELTDRVKNLEEAKAKESDILSLYEGDIEDRDQMLEDISLQNKIDAGIQVADDDSESDMLTEQAEADRIEAERRVLQEINAAAAREQAAAEQRAREETDARIAAEAASRAAAARAAADAARRNQSSGNGNNRDRGNRDTGGARGGGTSATSSGLGNLGFSDIRLKDNIELIGKSPSNINIYKFNYKGDSTIYQGAMANEVSWASVKADNGYLMIDYDKIDVEFKKYAK